MHYSHEAGGILAALVGGCSAADHEGGVALHVAGVLVVHVDDAELAENASDLSETEAPRKSSWGGDCFGSLRHAVEGHVGRTGVSDIAAPLRANRLSVQLPLSLLPPAPAAAPARSGSQASGELGTHQRRSGRRLHGDAHVAEGGAVAVAEVGAVLSQDTLLRQGEQERQGHRGAGCPRRFFLSLKFSPKPSHHPGRGMIPFVVW